MITEDYVSFETAKLLKEKGFNEICEMFYCKPHEGYMRNTKRNEWWNSDLREDMSCTCPTLQIAVKWLRENFNINPVPYALSLGWAFDIFDLSNKDITGCKKLFSMDLPSKSECYNSYEEACEAAIKYCLENLI